MQLSRAVEYQIAARVSSELLWLGKEPLQAYGFVWTASLRKRARFSSASVSSMRLILNASTSCKFVAWSPRIGGAAESRVERSFLTRDSIWGRGSFALPFWISCRCWIERGKKERMQGRTTRRDSEFRQRSNCSLHRLRWFFSGPVSRDNFKLVASGWREGPSSNKGKTDVTIDWRTAA